MPGLSDMEELLPRIQNKQITDYMREALGCYNAAAYRACIVLCYIALFDDLRQKLGHLRHVNSIAKTISDEVEKRANDQQIYEKYMVDQLKATDLITEIEAFRLEQVRLLRNKAAHPSGMHPSPEEARYVYFETIDKFLSQQVLKTTHGVDDLIARLANDNFFPSGNVQEVAAIVSIEIASLHSLVLPYLLGKLVHAIDSGDAILTKNAERFLAGLAMKNESQINQNIQTKVLVPKADDSSKRLLLMTLLSLNPTLLNDLDPTTIVRLRTIMTNHFESEKDKSMSNVSHPVVLFGNIVEKLGEDYVQTNLPSFWSTAPQMCYSGPIIKAAASAPKLRELLVSTWVQNAGSSTYDIANSFATNAARIDSSFTLLTPQEGFTVVLAVCRAAAWNAFDAIELRDERFAGTPTLRNLARRYAQDNVHEAESIVEESLQMQLSTFVAQYLTEA